MKKLLAFLFLLSTPAFAIDKPIPCEGASCKLKFETRDGSNVKVSAGNVDGSGKWTFGASSGTQTHQVNGKLRTVDRGIEIGGASAQGVYAGFYQSAVNPASTVSCTTECQNTDGTNGFGSTSGLCLAAWQGATVSTCGDATNAVKYCLCAGAN